MERHRTDLASGSRWRCAAGALRASTAAMVALMVASQAHAEITNEATAAGTYGGAPVTSNASSTSVPVAPPNQVLTVAVASAGFNSDVVGGSDLDPGDTLTFVVTVRNDGNITLRDVAPTPQKIDFNGQAYAADALQAGAQAPVTLAPGEEKEFSYTYTLAAADIYSAAGVENGVTSAWGAAGTGRTPDINVTAGTSASTIPANPQLTIAKSFAITTDNGTKGAADTDDIITYTYVVTNNGNVPLTDIHVSDSHENGEAHGETFDSASYAGALGDEPGQWNLAETTPAVFGANEDSKADDASFGTLGVGGVVTFTYAHQVTQAEFDAQ